MVAQRLMIVPAMTRMSVWAGLREVWCVLGAMARARATRRMLAQMDARELADIGVSRGDAMAEAARPFWDLGRRV